MVDTLTSDQHVTPMELALEQVMGGRLERLRQEIPKPWDYTIDNELQPYYAESVAAFAWPAGVGSNQLRINSIKFSILLHKLRGTDGALELFGGLAGFTYRYILHDRTAMSKTTMEIWVTPSLFADNDADWVRYISRVIRDLLPWWIDLGVVHIIDSFRSALFSVVALRTTDYEFFEGTEA